MKGVLNRLLQRGVTEGVFPSAYAVVFAQGTECFSGGTVDAHYDLASLTKVMATMALVIESGLPLTTRARHFFPHLASDATIDDLLFHRAGFEAFAPFFVEEFARAPELLQPDCPMEVRKRARARVVERAAALPVTYANAYSDVGFILLGAALEAAHHQPLDALFAERIARPLGLTAHFRRLSTPSPKVMCAPTGIERPRPPAPGQSGWEAGPPRDCPGEVDDDNAWVMDGVAGHAGLFGTARDVASFGQAVLDGTYGPPTAFQRDASGTRARGFDTPSATAASCGPRIGHFGPLGAVGHTGFTGTSLWVDFDLHLVVSLLTNRVATGRQNTRIVEFRPAFHEAVVDAITSRSS